MTWLNETVKIIDSMQSLSPKARNWLSDMTAVVERENGGVDPPTWRCLRCRDTGIEFRQDKRAIWWGRDCSNPDCPPALAKMNVLQNNGRARPRLERPMRRLEL